MPKEIVGEWDFESEDNGNWQVNGTFAAHNRLAAVELNKIHTNHFLNSNGGNAGS
jgi:hypothetical protein